MKIFPIIDAVLASPHNADAVKEHINFNALYSELFLKPSQPLIDFQASRISFLSSATKVSRKFTP